MENDNNMDVLVPPPAPKKVHIRKMIKVSSRIRRRLDFDFADCAEQIAKKKCMEIEEEKEKEKKENNQRITMNSSRYFRPIIVPPGVSSPRIEKSTGWTIEFDDNKNQNEVMDTRALSEKNIYKTPEKK